MKVSREQAVANRDRVIDVAGSLFQQNGFDGIGIADVMKAAGLSHGGFYGQFNSKDDLAVQACDRVLTKTIEKLDAVASREPKPTLAMLLERYLSAEHRANVGEGCVFAALAVDVARQDNPPLRRRFAEAVKSYVGIVARVVPGRSAEARREKALATVSGMVGAMILARAVDDPALSDAIFAAVRNVMGAKMMGIEMMSTGKAAD
jgi:TetR/AcrR family transcriptional repressor of nem operon